MALYEELRFVDLVAPMLPLIHAKRWQINLDKKFEVAPGRGYDENSPWIHTKFDGDRNCGLWSGVMFKVFRIVPKGCFDCWKVVTRPRNLKETMAVLELQKKMNLPSKVGMEQRDYSGKLGGWGAFWYCPLGGGLAGARKHHRMVEKAVHKKVSPELNVFLKRACTEMEMGLGPTEKWVYQKEWEMFEELIVASFEPLAEPGLAPKFLEMHVMRKWIEWASSHGDETYLEYVDNPIVSDYDRYNGSIHRDKDFGPITGKEFLNGQVDNTGHICREGKREPETETGDGIPEAITVV